MMDRLRTSPPASIAGIPVATVADLKTGEIRDVRTGKTVGRYDLPAADVIFFTLEDGTKVIGRPSGTEPKIKFYVLTRAPGDDLPTARAAATARIKAVIEDIVKQA